MYINHTQHKMCVLNSCLLYNETLSKKNLIIQLIIDLIGFLNCDVLWYCIKDGTKKGSWDI